MRARPGEATETMLRLLLTRSADCIEWPHTVNSKGYGQVGVGGKSTSVHVLACEHHHGPRPAGKQVAHSCNNKLCVNRDHIRWATPVENAADKVAAGTAPVGVLNKRAKLTEAQVMEIRQRFAAGESSRALGMEFGISRWTVNAIDRGELWPHLPLAVAS